MRAGLADASFRQLCQPILGGGGMGACLRRSCRRTPRHPASRQARR
jgi:hypothetical protein